MLWNVSFYYGTNIKQIKFNHLKFKLFGKRKKFNYLTYRSHVGRIQILSKCDGDKAQTHTSCTSCSETMLKEKVSSIQHITD